MNTNTTTRTIAAENCDGNGHVAIMLCALLDDIRSSESIKNVHHEDYMSKQRIIDRFESITGEVLSSKRTKEYLVNCVKASYSYYDSLVICVEDKPEEVNEMLVGKEIGFDVTGVIEEKQEMDAFDYEREFLETEAQNRESEDFVAEVLSEIDLAEESIIVGKAMGNSCLPTPVDPLVTSEYRPLYNKEDNCDIESKSLDKRVLMAKVINAASSNIVKAFITRGMLLSIINKELFGVESLYKSPEFKVHNQGAFSPEEVALATKTLDELVSDYLIPHKMGYIVKPYYMAWFHKNANLTYKVKGREYLINTTRKVIINLVTKRAVPLNKANCEWLNDGFFVRLAK